jgi:alkanesulfonate monooxygenase SsuD/methylene tetrahydromethanopterin reductase-like flavin-dependent oxidoreductase (luciferase family)
MDGDSPRGADVLAMTRMAEAVGFDSVWIPDHVLIHDEGREPQGVWECGAVLGALCAATSRVEIGALVVATSFRNPALTAKIASTVDELSGGRFIFGLGTGRHEPEHRAYGYPFGRQVDRFEEALQIILPLLREGYVDFEGTYYTARECELRPRGPRPEGPPILIGALGTGPRMLGLTARYADLWNVFIGEQGTGNRVERIPALREAVDAACLAVGRDPATLARSAAVKIHTIPEVPLTTTAYTPLVGSPEELAAALRAYADEGISHVQLWIEPNTPAGIAAFAPVLERLDYE